MISELQAYKQSVITEAVTHGLNPNVKMKDSGIEWIGEIPMEWKTCKVKNVVNLITNKVSIDKELVVALENIESGTGKYIETENKYIGEGVLAKKNDILFGKLRPYLAKVLLCNKELVAFGDIYVLRCMKELYAGFWTKYFISDPFIKWIDSSTYGTKMPRTNWDFIAQTYVVVPPLSEQQTIATYLDAKCSDIDRLS